ncbi:hypothetical protein HDV00_004001 [Rhizophlyctis rosea]|nr:hypothetical protein HDV00_004001 [Rhizophlyctis rosea]
MDSDRPATPMRRSRSSSDIINEEEGKPTESTVPPSSKAATPIIDLPPLPVIKAPPAVSEDREADIGEHDDDEPFDDSSDGGLGLGLQEEERVRRMSVPSWVIEDKLAQAGFEPAAELKKGKSMRMMLSVGNLGMVGEDMEEEGGEGEEGAGEEGSTGQSEEAGVEEVTVVVPDVEVASTGGDDESNRHPTSRSSQRPESRVRRISALEDRMGKIMAELDNDDTRDEEIASEGVAILDEKPITLDTDPSMSSTSDIPAEPTIEATISGRENQVVQPPAESRPVEEAWEQATDTVPATDMLPTGGEGPSILTDAETGAGAVQQSTATDTQASSDGIEPPPATVQTEDSQLPIPLDISREQPQPQPTVPSATQNVENPHIQPTPSVFPTATEEQQPPKREEHAATTLPATTLPVTTLPITTLPATTLPATTLPAVPIHDIQLVSTLAAPPTQPRPTRPLDRVGSRIPVRVPPRPTVAASKPVAEAPADLGSVTDVLQSEGDSKRVSLKDFRDQLGGFNAAPDMKRLRSGRRMTVLTRAGLTLEVREDLPPTPGDILSSVLTSKVNRLRHFHESLIPEPGPDILPLDKHTTPNWLRARYQSAGTAQALTPHDEVPPTSHPRHPPTHFSRYSQPLPIARKATSAYARHPRSRSEYHDLMAELRVRQSMALEKVYLGPTAISPRVFLKHYVKLRNETRLSRGQSPGGSESVNPTFNDVRPSHETFAVLGKVHWDEDESSRVRTAPARADESARRGSGPPGIGGTRTGRSRYPDSGPTNLRGHAIPPVPDRANWYPQPPDERQGAGHDHRPWTSPDARWSKKTSSVPVSPTYLSRWAHSRGIGVEMRREMVEYKHTRQRHERVPRAAEPVPVRT